MEEIIKIQLRYVLKLKYPFPTLLSAQLEESMKRIDLSSRISIPYAVPSEFINLKSALSISIQPKCYLSLPKIENIVSTRAH